MRNPAALRLTAVVVFTTASVWLSAWSSTQAPTAAPRSPSPGTWYKGNLHTHTINSDGDTAPDEVTRWYKEHRYHFLVLTDHDYVTAVDGLNSVLGAANKFLVVRGEEVTARFEKKPIHVNAFNPSEVVKPQGGISVLDTLQRNIDAIRRVNGIPSVNHPNFGWALTTDDLREVQNTRLFELYNGHPGVNNMGGGGSPSLEQVWDALLTSGRRLYGIAVDDAHYFKQYGSQFSNPGRGWVSVRAPDLSVAAVLEALERGDFYASTGVVLTDVSRDSGALRLEIRAASPFKYTTEFIGENGRVLKTSFENPATYALASSDRYVRARVIASNGDFAWTQPLFRD